MFKRLFIIFTLFVAFAYAKYEKDYRTPASLTEPVAYDASFKM